MNSFVALILVSLITSAISSSIQNNAEAKGYGHDLDQIPYEYFTETCESERDECHGLMQRAISVLSKLLAAFNNKTQVLEKAEKQLSEIREGFSYSFDTTTRLHTLNLCEEKKHNLECPSGSTIEVIEANYGRKSKEICIHQQMYNTSCTQPTALRYIVHSCNFRQTCRLFAGNYVYGDPCPHTYKYLEVKHKCNLTPMTTTMAPTTTHEPLSSENE